VWRGRGICSTECCLVLLSDGLFCRSENEGNVPEMVIIELQGDLETKSQSASLSGKFVGDLHFTKSVKVLLQCIMYRRKLLTVLH